MIQSLLQYPDPRIRLISANVRFFNDELHQWIEDMRESMIANELEALSAILIGIQQSIIVMEERESYISYINPRIVRHQHLSTKTERSIYYPGISADIDRYDEISIVYENELGDSKTKVMTGDNARVFQQHYDHCFGSTFVDRCEREMKERINDYLEFGLVKDGGSCPTVFYRDYFKRGVEYSLSFLLLSWFTPLVGLTAFSSWVYSIDQAVMVLALVLMIGYFFYAQYESKLYKQCTSCQTGNILGTLAILLFKLIIIASGVFVWVAP